MTNLEGTIMDEGDRNMDRFLTDLHILKEQLMRAKGPVTKTPSLQTGDMEDVQQKIDVLLTRLQSC